ncbi:MAG: GTPase HflX [Candidatus Puniceispirillum sp.]|nr:GTPase HflX [Candidatus Pelagibacter sp.]MBA4283718.1 GTPase HflX [Candidatus Puniceispirillum sp.]
MLDYLEQAALEKKGPPESIDRTPTQVKCFVVNVVNQRTYDENVRSIDDKLYEAIGLCEALNLNIVESKNIKMKNLSPSLYIGKGNLDEIKESVQSQKIDLVYFDAHLTPVHQRNLEKYLNTKVIDRTGIIIEIFALRARTNEGKLQVELAHLHHQRSRLVKAWSHLERQRGGGGFIGGPGESQKELDRRMLDTKLIRVKKDLAQVKKTRELHRKHREKNQLPTIALVGYTNAGKSMFFNKITKDKVLSQNMLFATLDTTLGQVVLKNNRKILLADTVGFISDLPTELIAAFRATLEETLYADVLIHVIDASSAHYETQRQDVYTVLKSLRESYAFENTQTILEVYNKFDLLDDEQQRYFANICDMSEHKFCISSLDGKGIPSLLKHIEGLFPPHISDTYYDQYLEEPTPLKDH